MEKKPRIYVIDDEETLCEALRFNLEAEGYDVDVAYSAEEALTSGINGYDLLLLDIMMGEMSGVKLAKVLKRNPATANIPIIFCTAKDTDDDMVAGLDLGADDYITKPFSMRNLLARVRSVLRRATPQSHSEALVYEGLEVNPADKTCKVDGAEVKMPRKEFEILYMLMSHPGHVFSREDLLARIWPDDVVVLNRVVDVNVTRLRSKLGQYGKNIVTKSGYGYLFSK